MQIEPSFRQAARSIAWAMLVATAACGAGAASGLAAASRSGAPASNSSPQPGTEGPLTGAATTYYRDLKPVIDAKCAVCHTAGGIGPFVLTTYGDVSAHLQAIGQAVASDLMPPWMPAAGCNQYRADMSLSADQKQGLLDWIAAGAPEGDAQAPGSPLAVDRGGLPRVDLQLSPPQPYKVRQQPDEYRCFVIPWPETSTKYVTGFNVNPNNASITHHAVMFVAKPADAAAVRKRDGADGFPGYECMGENSAGGASPNWIGAWEPGNFGGLYAADESTGMRIDPGSVVVMQMHYHVEGDLAAALPDQSTLQLTLKDTVPKVGVTVPFNNLAWTQGQMPIPAGQADVAFTYSASPYLFYSLMTQMPAAKLSIYNVNLHMHVRGSKGGVSVIESNGTQECLLDVPHWNFHWQGNYALQTPRALSNTEQLSLNCHFDNSAAAQPVINGVKATPTNINWGEGTDNEMCVVMLYMSP